jgi:hypothetical protein
MVNKQNPKIFPKLFIGGAAQSFKNYLKKNNYSYEINYITDREDLISLIDTFSQYTNYKLPVIISDISFLKKRDQSLLLKFMDDSNLNIILLASRDNILDTIISRVKEFRKFYVADKGSQSGFIKINKAREMLDNDLKSKDETDSSDEDRIAFRSKYNPLLSYDDALVKKFSFNDKKKLLTMLEFSYE